jgi:predicted dehydrogenase
LQKNGSSPGVFINYDSETSWTNKHVTKVEIGSISLKSRINFGIIGAGNFTKRIHLPNLNKVGDNVSVGAIVCRKGSGALELAKEYGAVYASTSIDDVLNDSEINAVLIGTRHNLHAELTLKALKAGKHVFVEKPLAISENELRKIEQFFKENNVSKKNNLPVLLTGFNRRFSPFMSQIKETVKNRKFPLVMNYQMNAGYLSPDHWLRTEEGGGRNIGEACHIYDLFTFLTESDVTDIKVSSLHVASDEHADNENFTATLSFSDGSVGSLTYTSLGTNKYPKEILNIYVDENVFLMKDYKNFESYGLSKKNIQSDRIEKGHYEEIKAFTDALMSGGEWPIPLWQQIQATRIALAVEEEIVAGGA